MQLKKSFASKSNALLSSADKKFKSVQGLAIKKLKKFRIKIAWLNLARNLFVTNLRDCFPVKTSYYGGRQKEDKPTPSKDRSSIKKAGSASAFNQTAQIRN